MLATRLRFPWMSALLIAPILVVLAPAPAPELQATICLDLPIGAGRIPQVSLYDQADRLYRARNFSAAGDTLRAADRNLAELYDQLGRAWTIGMSKDSTPGDAFPALREAWKLDTVLGGAFTDILFAKTREIAPLAAIEYVKQGRDEDAIRASDTALMLGHEVYK